MAHRSELSRNAGLAAGWFWAGTVAVVLTTVIAVGCGGDDGGNGPTVLGAVAGTVYLPYEISAALAPAAGATVLLTNGDFDTSTVTGSTGAFFFDRVPTGTLRLVASLGLCLADTQMAIQVTKGDTTSANLTLSSSPSANCLGLPYPGAARVEIDPTGNRAILLYDAAYTTGERSHPAIVVVDLTTGEGSTHEFADLEDAYDLALISTDEVAINTKSASAFGVRFFNVATMTASRADAIYETDLTLRGGRMAIDASGEFLFITIGNYLPSTLVLTGKVYAVSLLTGSVVDADNNPADGNNAFDDDLVAGALGWAYNIAFDPAAGEILVGNRVVPEGPFLTAISLSKWGTFDRDSNLTAPVPGVRKIPMDPGFPGFGVEYWDFAQGTGVAAKSLAGRAGMVTYVSGGTTFTSKLIEEVTQLASEDYLLVVIPERQTWFTLVDDPRRPEEVRYAIEERELSTLRRHNRYETRFLSDEALVPRGFAVSAQNQRLYVAYRNASILEVFELCRGEECSPVM